MSPSDITWVVLDRAHHVFAELRQQMGDAAYAANREALRLFLFLYFTSDAGSCSKKREGAVAPVGGKNGRKHLKVRWALPGGGKRGGLRIAVAVHCESKRVWLAGAWARKDDPSDEDVDTALADVPE